MMHLTAPIEDVQRSIDQHLHQQHYRLWHKIVAIVLYFLWNYSIGVISFAALFFFGWQMWEVIQHHFHTPANTTIISPFTEKIIVITYGSQKLSVRVNRMKKQLDKIICKH